MSASSSSAPSPLATAVTSPSTSQNLAALPPLVTSPPPTARTTHPRPMSHASKNRLSQYSTGSIPSRSRPASYLFPVLHSSLSYTIVRDFAYPPANPLHYGPPPEPSGPPSGVTTPGSESKRFSDPPVSWESKLGWDWKTEPPLGKAGELALHFGDGPPYSEDEDLQSPVVSSRHRKHKSTSATLGHHRSRMETEDILNPSTYGQAKSYYAGPGGHGSERYYISQGGGEANGPGGEFVNYHPEPSRHSAYGIDQRPRGYPEELGYRSESDASSAASSPRFAAYDESRYSRDYQFTITSPDEEMHGKAVALFDFERENENELPLVEGQIIWVSYRHGQGWLVAEDPKTQESGLVPEEYVRLLRDIEGGMHSLTGHAGDGSGTPIDSGTPTQAEHHIPASPQGQPIPQATQPNAHTNGYHQPVVSTFSTSSKDLDPYPQHLLGSHSGQAPPQVVHYHGQRGGSQANTPTITDSFDSMGRSNSTASQTETLETLPGSRMKSPTEEAESDDAKESLQR